MAVGLAVALARKGAKKAIRKAKDIRNPPTAAQRAARAKYATNIEKIDERGRSTRTIVQDLRKGIDEFKKEAETLSRAADRRMARASAGAAAAVGAAAAADSGGKKRKARRDKKKASAKK